MSERLTVSLEDGIPDKLRTLAGGERKVGAYLSDVVAWLWEYREALQARPLSGMALVHNEWIMTPDEQQQQAEESARLNAELGAWRQRMDELQRKVDGVEAFVKAVIEATPNEDAKAAVRQSLIQQGLLVPQQDSSQNDA